MRERNRSERNWHTAEPRHHAEGVSETGGTEDAFLADERASQADSDAYQEELPPGGYGVGGERPFDPPTRQGSSDNRAERISGEGGQQDRESWSRARPRRKQGPQDPEWRTAGEAVSWRTRSRGHDWGGPRWRGQAAQPQSGEWYGGTPGGREDQPAPAPPRSAGFGWGGAPTGYGEWGGLEHGPFRAESGRGGYGGQWGSPSGSRQGGNEGRDEWNREHSMRGGEPWTVPGPHTGRGPQGYERSDQAILEDVCERLTRHGEVDASEITVRCERREVILEGTVDDRRAKRMAEDAADSVSGVRDVQNRLRIRDREDMRASAGSPAAERDERAESKTRRRPRPRK